MKVSSFHFIRLNPGKEYSDQELFEYELQCIDFAEEFGLDGVWLAEHHFRSDVCPSIIPMAAHVAARTKRIRIGLGVLVMPFYHPLRLAEDVAVLDILSNGRVDVGVGRGYNSMEFAGFGIDQDESRARLSESLDIALQAWVNGKVKSRSQYFDIDNVNVYPRPLQKPHPPVWVAATSPTTVELCGSMGVPFISDPIQSFEDAVELVGLWRGAAKEARHKTEGAELAALRPVWVADSLVEAIAARPVWVPQRVDQIEGGTGDSFDPGNTPSSQPEAIEPEAALVEEVRNNLNYLVGDSDLIVSKFKAYRDAGYNHIIAVFNSGVRQPIENVRQCMERFSKEALPEIQKL